MGAGAAEPPEKKVDESDILDAFDRRPQLGKWELSSSEVAELVNEDMGLEDPISRQAIHRRLERMDGVVKNKHGRTVTWRLASDELTIRAGQDLGGSAAAIVGLIVTMSALGWAILEFVPALAPSGGSLGPLGIFAVVLLTVVFTVLFAAGGRVVAP